MQHFHVWRALEGKRSKKDKALFEEFRFLKRAREKANYEIDERFNAADAEKIILSVKKFIMIARNRAT